MNTKYMLIATFISILLFCNVSTNASIIDRFVPKKGPGFGVATGIIFPSLSEVNDHAKTMDLEPFDSGIMLWGGTFRYAFSRQLQIGYYGAISNSTRNDVFEKDVVKEMDLTVGMHLGTIAYKFYKRDWEFTIGANGGYYFSTLTKDISSASYQFDEGIPSEDNYTFRSQLAGGTLGGAGFVGAKYRLNPIFAIGADVGYQYAIIELEQAGKNLSNAPELDLSGVRFRMSADIHY